jgi:predicted nucleotidyltransferase
MGDRLLMRVPIFKTRKQSTRAISSRLRVKCSLLSGVDEPPLEIGVVMFGARAKETSSPGSDVDIAVCG